MANFKKITDGRGYAPVCILSLTALLLIAVACEKVPEYCGEGQKLNPETQFCHNKIAYDKCGGSEYDPENNKCEGGILKTRCEGGSSFYNPATEFCSDGTPHEKCGGQTYSPGNQLCENGILKARCGDGESFYNVATEFCVENNVHTKCGGSIYSPDTQRCVGGALQTKCGDSFYSQTSEFCFGDDVYPKCGGNTYDPTAQRCDGTALRTRCGTSDFFYNPTSQFCSGQQVYSKCGGAEYDPGSQVCDAGAVKARCGATDYYSPATQFCLNETVYAKCKGEEYDPGTNKCESNVLKSKCGNSNSYYSPEVEFCVDNTVYEKCNGSVYDPATYECKDVSMVFVQGGTFMMGCTEEQGSDCYSDEKPVHRVTLSDFYIGRYEISQKQWEEVMGANPSSTKGYDLPVTDVSWDSVQVFIRKLNLQSGKSYRLPTEAEWEFAARGGVKSEGYKYAGSNTIGNVAWYYGNSNGLPIIGTKQPNELGIYDMSGSVSEWVHDDERTYNNGSQTNPMGSTSANDYSRGTRGGSYNSSAAYCRVSHRDWESKTSRYNGVGFRLAHSP